MPFEPPSPRGRPSAPLLIPTSPTHHAACVLIVDAGDVSPLSPKLRQRWSTASLPSPGGAAALADRLAAAEERRASFLAWVARGKQLGDAAPRPGPRRSLGFGASSSPSARALLPPRGSAAALAEADEEEDDDDEGDDDDERACRWEAGSYAAAGYVHPATSPASRLSARTAAAARRRAAAADARVAAASELEARLASAAARRAKHLASKAFSAPSDAAASRALSPDSRRAFSARRKWAVGRIGRAWRVHSASPASTSRLAAAFLSCGVAHVSDAVDFDVFAASLQAGATLRAARALLARLDARLASAGRGRAPTEAALAALSPPRRSPPPRAPRAPPPPRPAQQQPAVASVAAVAPSSPQQQPPPPPARRQSGGGAPAAPASPQPAPARARHSGGGGSGGGGAGVVPSSGRDRFPVRVVLCAWMATRHPDVVLSKAGRCEAREAPLVASAAAFVSAFEALLASLAPRAPAQPQPPSPRAQPAAAGGSVVGGRRSAAGASSGDCEDHRSAAACASRLLAFDDAWATYLAAFVAWKADDAAALAHELTSMAAALRSSLLRKIGTAAAAAPAAAAPAANASAAASTSPPRPASSVGSGAPGSAAASPPKPSGISLALAARVSESDRGAMRAACEEDIALLTERVISLLGREKGAAAMTAALRAAEEEVAAEEARAAGAAAGVAAGGGGDGGDGAAAAPAAPAPPRAAAGSASTALPLSPVGAPEGGEEAAAAAAAAAGTVVPTQAASSSSSISAAAAASSRESMERERIFWELLHDPQHQLPTSWTGSGGGSDDVFQDDGDDAILSTGGDGDGVGWLSPPSAATSNDVSLEGPADEARAASAASSAQQAAFWRSQARHAASTGDAAPSLSLLRVLAASVADAAPQRARADIKAALDGCAQTVEDAMAPFALAAAEEEAGGGGGGGAPALVGVVAAASSALDAALGAAAGALKALGAPAREAGLDAALARKRAAAAARIAAAMTPSPSSSTSSASSPSSLVHPVRVALACSLVDGLRLMFRAARQLRTDTANAQLAMLSPLASSPAGAAWAAERFAQRYGLPHTEQPPALYSSSASDVSSAAPAPRPPPTPAGALPASRAFFAFVASDPKLLKAAEAEFGADIASAAAAAAPPPPPAPPPDGAPPPPLSSPRGNSSFTNLQHAGASVPSEMRTGRVSHTRGAASARSPSPHPHDASSAASPSPLHRSAFAGVTSLSSGEGMLLLGLIAQVAHPSLPLPETLCWDVPRLAAAAAAFDRLLLMAAALLLLPRLAPPPPLPPTASPAAASPTATAAAATAAAFVAASHALRGRLSALLGGGDAPSGAAHAAAELARASRSDPVRAERLVSTMTADGSPGRAAISAALVRAMRAHLLLGGAAGSARAAAALARAGVPRGVLDGDVAALCERVSRVAAVAGRVHGPRHDALAAESLAAGAPPDAAAV